MAIKSAKLLLLTGREKGKEDGWTETDINQNKRKKSEGMAEKSRLSNRLCAKRCRKYFMGFYGVEEGKRLLDWQYFIP